MFSYQQNSVLKNRLCWEFFLSVSITSNRLIHICINEFVSAHFSFSKAICLKRREKKGIHEYAACKHHAFNFDLNIFVCLSSEFQIEQNLSLDEDIRFFSCVALLSPDCTLEACEAIFCFCVSSDTNPIVKFFARFFFSADFILHAPKQCWMLFYEQ